MKQITTLTRWLRLCGCVLVLMVLAVGIRAQDDEVRQTVARVSYIYGDVALCRGDDPDNWQSLVPNVPMVQGDRAYTGDKSRLELQLEGGHLLLLDDRTDLGVLRMDEDLAQFSLGLGTAVFHVRDLYANGRMEMDTPNAAVTLREPGEYRFFVDESGDTTLTVWRGSAEVLAGGQEFPLNAGMSVQLRGIDSPEADYVGTPPPDGFDRWVQAREDRLIRGYSHPYGNARIVGLADLDEHGRWENIPAYGWAWTPYGVAADWAPYRVGRWVWEDPWGWTWVDDEPWGWAPCHYGRWASFNSRWYWLPEAPGAARVRYAPALVAFVGVGSGWSVSFSMGEGGYIGWFPLGQHEPFHPWWGRYPQEESYGPSVTYVNETFVTVVNHNTFVSGGEVSREYVRDSRVLAAVEKAPVLRGPVPLVPSAGATRVTRATARPAAVRPPEEVRMRPVVTRTSPPPPPLAFTAKQELIRARHGAPVPAAVATQSAGQEPPAARATPPTRPAERAVRKGSPAHRVEGTAEPPDGSAAGTTPAQLRETTRGRPEQPSGGSQTDVNPSTGEREPRKEVTRKHTPAAPEKRTEGSKEAVVPGSAKEGPEKQTRESETGPAHFRESPRESRESNPEMGKEPAKPSSGRALKESRPATAPTHLRPVPPSKDRPPSATGTDKVKGQKEKKKQPGKEKDKHAPDPADQTHN